MLAVGGDAARILQWGADTPAAIATFSLAVAVLKWSKDLQGIMPGWCCTVEQASAACLFELAADAPFLAE